MQDELYDISLELREYVNRIEDLQRKSKDKNAFFKSLSLLKATMDAIDDLAQELDDTE